MSPTRKIPVADERKPGSFGAKSDPYAALPPFDLYARLRRELEELVGKGYDRSLQESEIQRMVTETLLADARTESVDQFLLPGKEKLAVSAALRVSGMRRKL